MPKHTLAIFMMIISFYSCNENPNRQKVVTTKEITKPTIKKLKNNDSLKNLLQKNIEFFSDSLLKGNKSIIQSYMSKYQTDTCGIIIYKNSSLKSEFEGVKSITDITGNNTADSVFVIPPFNYCDDGESYCLYDKRLPRLYIDSYCCHPNDFFVIQDIDEDGIREIGIYYSSCASRYKSLRIFSLKKGQWKEIGESDFDVLTQDPTKVQFEKLVRKVSKNKFRVCNFIDGETKWDTLTMK